MHFEGKFNRGPQVQVRALVELFHRNPGYKITRIWKNFNKQGTKMILLSDKLWLIANNSRSFANDTKSIIRNNLGL